MEKRITSDIIKNARKIAAGCICILTAVFVVIYGDNGNTTDANAAYGCHLFYLCLYDRKED